MALPESDQVGARGGGDCRLGSQFAVTERMLRAIHHVGRDQVRHCGGVLAKLRQFGQPAGALALHVRLRKRGIAQHIGGNCQRTGEIGLEREQRHPRALGAAPNVERGAQLRQFFGYLQRRSGAGSFIEHGGGEPGQARQRGRIGAGAGAHDQFSRHQWQRWIVMMDHRHAVGQLE